MTERARQLAWERRWALAAALSSFAVVAFYVISVLLEQGSGLQTGTNSEELRSFHDHSGALLVSTILRSIGFLLLSIPLLYLFRAARARSEKVRPEMVGFAFIGPVLLAAQGFVAWIASGQTADEFVDQVAGAARPNALAERLIDDSGLREVAAALLIPAVLALMVALLYISLHAMRTGLLTRFAGSLGMALGVAMILILPLALLMILLWLLYVGLLFLGKVPGGKPPAWTTGEAIPWPTPGEKAAAELEPDEQGATELERDEQAATELEPNEKAAAELEPDAPKDAPDRSPANPPKQDRSG